MCDSIIFFSTYLNSIAEILSNRLTQVDLLILEISLKLLRTPPSQLVSSLSQFELYRLSQLFLQVSSPDHQYINNDQFEKTFRSFLRTTMSDFHTEDDENLRKIIIRFFSWICSNVVSADLDALIYGILGSDGKKPRTWPQFLLDSTIPTLLNRFNHRNLNEFLSRFLSTQRSSSPTTTAELVEQVDQQIVTNLIKNLLEKFRTKSPTRKN